MEKRQAPPARCGTLSEYLSQTQHFKDSHWLALSLGMHWIHRAYNNLISYLLVHILTDQDLPACGVFLNTLGSVNAVANGGVIQTKIIAHQS
jgi:hypothetical protein